MHGKAPQDTALAPLFPVSMRRLTTLSLLLSIATALPALADSGQATLELEDCRISAGPAFPSLKARCGTLERPLDPSAPDAETIGIRVALVPALNLEPEPDPVVPIAGGPGQGAVQFYSAYAGAFEALRRDRDILLVDQRGTGSSARLDCPTDEELIEGQYSREQTLAYTRECLDALPYDPRFFTTSVAVTDLEAVRLALDLPTLNLYGISYGSRVAQHYARRYPDSTRTVILDGVVPPQLPLGPEIALEAQRAVEAIFARCAENPACDDAFPEVADEFAALTTRLEKRAVEVELADPLTGRPETIDFGRAELAAAVRLLAYHPQSIAMLPLLVSEAADGRYAPLAAQFVMTLRQLSDALAIGMHNSVMCTEDVPFFRRLRIDREAIAATYIGVAQIDALEAICSLWPAGPLDENLREPLATDAPTLLLSGTADPITPPRYANLAAQGLRRAWLLTQPGQGHGQIAVGCMPRIVAQFVANAGLDEVDTGCIEQAFVMPFMLDFTGPSP